MRSQETGTTGLLGKRGGLSHSLRVLELSGVAWGGGLSGTKETNRFLSLNSQPLRGQAGIWILGTLQNLSILNVFSIWIER